MLSINWCLCLSTTTCQSCLKLSLLIIGDICLKTCFLCILYLAMRVQLKYNISSARESWVILCAHTSNNCQSNLQILTKQIFWNCHSPWAENRCLWLRALSTFSHLTRHNSLLIASRDSLAAIGSERGLYMAKSLQLVKAYLALMLMVAWCWNVTLFFLSPRLMPLMTGWWREKMVRDLLR